MIRPAGFRPAVSVARPRAAVGMPSLPTDQVTLSGRQEPPRGIWGRLKDWAMGATREEAVKQAPPLVAPAVQSAPVDLTLDASLGPVAELGRAMLKATPRESLARDLRQRSAEDRLNEVARDVLKGLPEAARDKAARAALEHLAPQHEPSRQALQLLPHCSGQESRLKLAFAALEERPLVEQLSRQEKGAAGRVLLRDELAVAMHQACSDNTSRGHVVERMLAVERPDARTVLEMMRTWPADHPTSRNQALEVAVERLPGIDLTRRAFQEIGERSVKLSVALAGLADSLEPPSPARTAAALLKAVPAEYPNTRKKVGNALLEELRGDLSAREAQALLAIFPQADRGAVAEAALKASARDYPEIAALALAMLASSTDSRPRAFIADQMLSSALAGKPPTEAALGMLERFPSDFPSTARKAAQVLLDRQPELELVRLGASGVSDTGLWTRAVLAGCRARAGSPAEVTLAMLGALPAETNSSAVNLANNMLPKVPGGGPALSLLQTPGDNRGRRLAVQACLEQLLRQATPRQQMLAGLRALPGDLTETKTKLSRAAAREVGDAALGEVLEVLTDGRASSALAMAWLGARERGLPQATVALQALQAIPGDFPTSRIRAADVVMDRLDSPLARLAAAMRTNVDSTPRWAMYQAALSQIEAGEPPSLLQAAHALLRAMPNKEYNTSCRNAALNCARYLTTVYTDPEAVGILQGVKSYNGMLEALEQLKDHKSIQQQVEDMARAVTGRDETRALEQRDGLLVVGGTRVKVRETSGGQAVED